MIKFKRNRENAKQFWLTKHGKWMKGPIWRASDIVQLKNKNDEMIWDETKMTEYSKEWFRYFHGNNSDTSKAGIETNSMLVSKKKRTLKEKW